MIIGFDAPNGFNGILSVPDKLSGVSVVAIAQSAFSQCTSLTSITIPDSVTSIGVAAFFKCSNLSNITIPHGVSKIAYNSFFECTSLTSVTIPSSVTSIDGYAFAKCTSLTSVTIPSSVTSMGDGVFSGCIHLTSVAIPSGLTSMGNYLFYNCSSLSSVTIPNGVTSIGDNLFFNCSSLTSVTIPSGVTSIGNYAFCLCSSLNYVTFKNMVTSIGDGAFNIGSAKTIIFIVPNHLKEHYWNILNTSVMGDTFATIKKVPAVPANVNAVSSNYNSIILTWTADAGATGYSIYRSTSPTSGFTYLKGATKNSYTDTGLTTGTTYYYRIKTYIMAGTLKVVSPLSITVNAKPIPAKPTGVVAVSAGYNSNKLTWDTVDGATGYSIYRSTSPTSGFTYLKGATKNSYTDTGLTTGTTYYYQIKAYVMVGTKKVMSTVSATVSAKPIPATPTGLKVAVASNTSIKTSWNAVTGATGYSIYRSTSPDSGFTYIKGVTGTSYTNTGLTTGTIYYYQIKAYVKIGTNKIMSPVSETVSVKPIPAKPTGLEATVIDTTSIKVSWNTVVGATGYSIYRSTSPDSDFTYIKGVTGTSYSDTLLTTGNALYYKVKAYTMVGTTKVYSTTTSAVEAKP